MTSRIEHSTKVADEGCWNLIKRRCCPKIISISHAILCNIVQLIPGSKKKIQGNSYSKKLNQIDTAIENPTLSYTQDLTVLMPTINFLNPTDGIQAKSINFHTLALEEIDKISPLHLPYLKIDHSITEKIKRDFPGNSWLDTGLCFGITVQFIANYHRMLKTLKSVEKAAIAAAEQFQYGANLESALLHYTQHMIKVDQAIATQCYPVDQHGESPQAAIALSGKRYIGHLISNASNVNAILVANLRKIPLMPYLPDLDLDTILSDGTLAIDFQSRKITLASNKKVFLHLPSLIHTTTLIKYGKRYLFFDSYTALVRIEKPLSSFLISYMKQHEFNTISMLQISYS